jgi:uncharacterized DUF497 family protein
VIFAYDDWNREHVAKHGVSHADAEYVIESARRPYPKKIEEGKFIVYGPDRTGRVLEVVFAFKSADQIDFDTVDLLQLGDLSEAQNPVAVYIIHAMPISGRTKKRYRRRLR